jgi:plasmid stabilization system protein ParE
MPRLVWTPYSSRDLRRHHDFLVEKDRKAAARAIQAIYQRLQSLILHPDLGRPIDESIDESNTGRRELVIPFGQSSYVALYQHNGEEITVLAIRHGREAGY